MLEAQKSFFLTLKMPSAIIRYVNLSVPLPSDTGICLRNSTGRGAGTIPPVVCKDDEEIYGGLCYPKCRDGFESVGCCLCRHIGCPPGFTDDGVATCIKPEAYGRGVGYPWKFGDIVSKNGMLKRCEADYGVGNCEEYGLVIYPKCKSGFHNVGCCICSPDCPAGMNDMGISCAKETYGRGTGTARPQCPDNEEEDAFLCYNKCQSGFHGIGPVCWENCPSSKPINCGVMCTVNEITCYNETSSIVKAAIQIGAELFVGIATSDVILIIQAAIEANATITNVLSNDYC